MYEWNRHRFCEDNDLKTLSAVNPWSILKQIWWFRINLTGILQRRSKKLIPVHSESLLDFKKKKQKTEKQKKKKTNQKNRQLYDMPIFNSYCYRYLRSAPSYLIDLWGNLFKAFAYKEKFEKLNVVRFYRTIDW